jgi:hypothetical protein
VEYGTAGDDSGVTVSASQVRADKALAEGKFAVVKAGKANVNGETLPVAVKALKR